MSDRLRHFVAQLMAYAGADYEFIEPNGLELLLPGAVGKTLSLPEMARLGFGVEMPVGAQRVSLESDWLERMQKVLGEDGRWLHLAWMPDMQLPSSPERILEHGFILSNAVFRLESAVKACTRYLLMVWRFSALADEKREGIVRIGYNLSNGAMPDAFLDELLMGLFANPNVIGSDVSYLPGCDISLPELWEEGKIQKIMQRALPLRVGEQLDKFKHGLERRQERDLDRLHGYFSDLQREMVARKTKTVRQTVVTEPQVEEDYFRLRNESIIREYQLKVADLRQKYAMTVNVEFIQGMTLVMPVYRLHLIIKRRKGERRFHLDWNPAVRKLETPPCEYAFSGNTARQVCDDALHLVSARGYAECAGCGKPFCHVCFAKACPKCSRPLSGDDV